MVADSGSGAAALRGFSAGIQRSGFTFGGSV